MFTKNKTKNSPVRDCGRLLQNLNTITTAGFFPLDPTYQISSESEKKLFADGRTHGWTDILSPI